MAPHLFATPAVLIQGAIAGLILGFLLQKSRLPHFQTIVDQFLLRDFTMIKVMFTAIIVGSIGIQLLLGIGLPLKFYDKGDSILAVLIGGGVFGLGMTILGYCPGTCIAASAQGSRDAKWGLLGMLCGAFAFAELYGFFEKNVLSVGKITKYTLSQLFNVSPWVIILVFTVVALTVFRLVKKKGPKEG